MNNPETTKAQYCHELEAAGTPVLLQTQLKFAADHMVKEKAF